jgi:LuxR family transcriptional regulator, positive regulator of biofilm formation
LNIKVPEKQMGLRSCYGATFYLVGPLRLQNELIAKCLEKENGNSCILLENISQIPTDNPKPGAQPILVLWDCHGEDLQRLLTEIKTYTSRNKSKTRFVIFNVSDSIEFKKNFVTKGIHGFFYKHDSQDIFLKGVQAVLDGKLWLSREMMTQCIFEDSDSDMPPVSISGKLTERQTEIIALMAVGATNHEIADKLCISPHTVKTHIYKIFKEIKVPNRVQASLWAAKYL